jgi:hypothetical protein
MTLAEATVVVVGATVVVVGPTVVVVVACVVVVVACVVVVVACVVVVVACVVVVVGATVVVVGATVVVVVPRVVVVVVGAVVVVVGATVVVVGATVVVVVVGVPGVTPPLSSVVSSWSLMVAMHTSVDAQETLLPRFVVLVLACHVEPPSPVPASTDRVVEKPPAAQHVKVLAQLIELKPSRAGAATVAHVVPESVLVTTAGSWELTGAPEAKQTVVPVGHDTDCRAPNWPRVDECDWDQVVPLEVVAMAVPGPVDESAPTATQLDAEEQEMPSRK